MIDKNILRNIKLFSEKSFMKNLPEFNNKEYPIINIENPVHETNKTIEELKEIIIQQSINNDKQAIVNKRLTYLALVFAFISIVPVLREYIPIFQPKKDGRDIYELENKVLSQSNNILENQVRILKVENELMKAKKTSEKGKKP